MANHQIPLVENFGVSKTLLSQIANSPYYKKFDSTVFSKILFKPGYPLQSVELIELQDILQEQIRRFGNHVFQDGSIVTSKGGIDVYDCQMYELQDGANESATITENDLIVFVDTNNSAEVLKGRFIDFYSARIVDGVVQPTKIGLIFNNGLTQDAITTTNVVDVYVQNSAGTNTTKIGTLNSVTPSDGKYANIKNNTFYISGYFTNINEQNYIFAVSNINNINAEVGIELTWRIVDITDDDYKEQLFDPAQNSLNDNTPGADRLILQLQLTHHDFGYIQQETDWKFIPLLKYDNGNVVFRSKYPFYSVLGDTLARRTYEINGNFVVDNFKLEVRSDLQLLGTHRIAQYEIIGEEIIYTIDGTDTNYFDLQVGNYVMFGSDINYNRLLLIKEIESSTKIKVSDIHYDQYEDRNSAELLTPTKVGTDIILRDEEKINYILSEGKAYVKGYRFETSFTTRLKDNKARKTKTVESSLFPNQHYFELLNYYHSEDFIFFDRLEKLDLHCTEILSLYYIDIVQNAGNFSQPLVINIGDRIDINGTVFEKRDVNNNYKLISYSKSNTTGLPTPGSYTVTNLTTNVSGLYDLNNTLFSLEYENAPYERVATANYSSYSLSGITTDKTTIVGNLIDFRSTSGSFSTNFNTGEIVLVEDENGFSMWGYIDSFSTSTVATVKTFVSFIDDTLEYTFTKPSYFDYYNYQYNSTKIGTIRSNSVGVDDPERFRFSHFELEKTEKSARVCEISGNQISIVSLNFSRTDDVYNGLYLTHQGNRWRITDYIGQTQTFVLDNVSLTNPISFTVDESINIEFSSNDIKSLVKSSYANGKEFYADIAKTVLNIPIIKTPNQTQKKFAPLIEAGEGEVKTVTVSDYSIFYQDVWIVEGGNKSTLTKNIGTAFQEDYNISTDNLKVYAAEVIFDTLGTGNIMYHKGEHIPISSANIVDYILTINFNEVFVNGDKFIVHADIPVEQPVPRFKDLKTNTDTFSVAVNVSNQSLIVDNDRYHGNIPFSFELMHSDVYRIRKVRCGIGKTAPLVDITDYFDLDTGQRETHYDFGRIILKPYLTLPTIANINTTNAFYYFEVEYDYFESTTGHYFTVNSYQDIHYRKIPTYTDPIKNKFPLRNVIDFRPVRQPKGSLYDYENEADIVSLVNYEFDYYLNEEKVISLEGNGSSDIGLKFENLADYSPSDFNIKLYDLTLPAYTFSFNDVDYKMIDNRNFTMKDISKLQKRIENLEDIVQLNALELQAIQTNLTDSNGDARYTNGLLVDQFAGFAIAKVDQEGFAASIDIKDMKLYPSFQSENTLLKPSPTAVITSTYPRIRNNIIMLPIVGETLISDTIINAELTTKPTQIGLINGKLTLHPFSDTWYSKSSNPNILLNEDNQYKNWKELGTGAFGTQWNIWEQFWSGEELDKNIVTLANATLAQKTGQMVNNKNNIEKIINDKKINTTISLLNREKRIGFMLDMLDTDLHDYQVFVNGNLVGTNQGQRLEFDASGTTSPSVFLSKFLNYQITQDIPLVGTAVGTIRNIEYVSTTAGKNKYYLYLTNVSNDLFQAGINLNNLVGTVVSEYTFSTLNLDTFGKLCGDFTLTDGDYPTNTSLDIQIRRVGSNIPVASNKFFLGGLLETKTSFTQSVRPVQRKLFSNSDTSYIDDKTFIINSTTRIQSPLHQPFIFDQSLFISKIAVRCKNTSAVNKKMIFTIQPMVNDNLSPSLVVPFSEQIVNVPANHNGELTINFDVPVFIASNSTYAFVFRSEDTLEIYTKTGTNTVLVDSCIPALMTTGTASEVIQLKIYHALFDTTEKQIPLYIADDNFNFYVDRYRLNVNTLKLTDTYVDYQWKARNYDSTTKDLVYTTISPNKTTLLEKRKIFSVNDYELICKLRSNDARYTPILDLERISLTTIRHYINNGGMLTKNITGIRSGTDANLVQLTIEQDPIVGLFPGGVCKLDIDGTGTVQSFYTDPNMLMYTPDFEMSLRKANTVTGLFENISTPVTYDYINNIVSTNNLSLNLDVKSEFSPKDPGNALYRYFSPVVTLGDDFEAMQLYVQMDAIIKRVNEVFVYYRVLENTAPFDTFIDQPYKRMNILTNDADKYSNSTLAKTIEFETSRSNIDSRFKYFQVKICFTSSNYIDVPIVENVRILALDN